MTQPPVPQEPPPPTGTPQSDPPVSSTPPAQTPEHDGRDPLRRSVTSGLWAGIITAIVLLVLLVVFIAQNTDSTTVRFLWLDGRTPLAVALLVATALGMALAGAIGSLRILQLRRRVKRGR